MKKILLVAAVALVAVSVSAMNRNHDSKNGLINDKKVVMTTPGAFKNMSEKMAAMNAFYSTDNMTRKVGQILKSNRAEEAEPQLIPSYSSWTYHYTTLLGGFIPQIMYSDASFLVKDGKAYLAPFANLGYVEGVVETVPSQYGEGIDSITFTASQIAVYTNKETQEKVELVLEPCYISNYTPYRLGEKTFGAYYIAETNELYLPSTVALFEKDETKTDIFDEDYVARRLNLTPKDDMNQYISKGTVSCTSYYGSQYNYSGNVEVYLGDGVYNIKGCDPESQKAWIEFDVRDDDQSVADVIENQFVARYNFYNDESRTETHPGDVVTVGLVQTNGELTGFNKDNDYVSTYKITDNADETTTIENTAGTCYGDYVFEDAAYGNGGMMNCVDMKITITYEPVYAGINDIAKEQNAKYAGATFNLNGQKVNSNQKGFVVRDGKKFFVK